MYNLNRADIFHHGSPASPALIEEIESIWAHTLPSDFNRFLLCQNGVIFSYENARYPHFEFYDDNWHDVTSLYATHSSERFPIALANCLSEYNLSNRLPKNIKPIGTTSVGRICLDVSSGQILYWYTAGMWWDDDEADVVAFDSEGQEYTCSIYPVAENFLAFWNEIMDHVG